MVVARNLATGIEDKDPKPFRYRSLGQLVDLGGASAPTDIFGIKVRGKLGKFVWKGVYFYELGHNLNRARVLLDWVTNLFFRPNTSKLFEE